MTFNFTYNYPQVARDSGFKLRNYKDGPLDWRLIGSVEIERVIKDQSFEQIDAVLNHLSEAPLGSILDSNILDSGIAKYFMISQFSVQYLMFCRKFLEETVTDLRESHSASQMELATLKRSLSEANNEILQLHKKITQMEAIHEVIYPCHLCTKNFVSNDALNLHISRKHSGTIGKTEKKFEAPPPPHSICKDRETDLTLINTIKLELEIKQLKERLNIAEREIKEKHLGADCKHVTDNTAVVLEKSETKSVGSIGIQSNLSEIKERDDSSGDEPSSSSQNRQQLCVLQEKLHEFEKWKEEQKHQNTEFLSEINNKMQDITNALEMSRNREEEQQVKDHEAQKSSTSVKDLEVMLIKKVEEIGKATAANVENVVNKMEISYRDKLDQLEKELNKLNEQYTMHKDLKLNENPINMEKRYLTKNENFKILHVNGNDNIQECKNESKEMTKTKIDEHLPKETSASESNHTFVKHSNVPQLEKNYNKNNEKSLSTSEDDTTENDTTDVSVSLLDEENIDKVHNDSTKTKTNKTHILKERQPLPPQPPAKPKPVTKKDARKLTNNRLTSLGVDIKAKTLTPLLKKRFLDDLSERRNKLKVKHSQFNATRNKIKKFVDKLCSTKMPPSAAAVLKDTKQHIRTKNQKHFDACDDEYSLSEKEEAESLKASTPLNENSTINDNEHFKLRLERILASPIRKPDDRSVKAIVHRENEHNKKPLPLPRKRVMFNHPEIRERRMNHSLSPTESEESQSFQR